MQQQHVVRESVRYMEECASGTFTLKDKEKTPGVADIFVLKVRVAALAVRESDMGRASNRIDSKRNAPSPCPRHLCQKSRRRPTYPEPPAPTPKLQWEKSATVHGGKNVAGGWCDESRNTVGSTEANVCCVCLDSETNVILKPCSHVEFCAMCIIGQACRCSTQENLSSRPYHCASSGRPADLQAVNRKP